MSIPFAITTLYQWVCWRLAKNPSGGKDKKIPIDAKTGKEASPTNPATWADYSTAAAAVQKYHCDGIGFVLTKECGIVGVDIDHCIDSQGTFNDIATAIVNKQQTYMEYSPSGDGIHLLFRGAKPPKGCRNQETGVEMYDGGRYLTVTGKTLPNSIDDIAEGTETLAWIHENYVAKRKTEKKTEPQKQKMKKDAPVAENQIADDELIQKAKKSKKGEIFGRLMGGDWESDFSSQSEADLALCCTLAFWTGKNAVQMDGLFRQSGLYRRKWDERHSGDGETYGEMTIRKAIELTGSTYTPPADKPQMQKDDELDEKKTKKRPIIRKEGKYYRINGDSCKQLTNFVVEPVEMVVAEDETFMRAIFVTDRGERISVMLSSTDFASQCKFKNLLNKKTISLSYFGTDGDLEALKAYIADLSWPRKSGVKVLGIHEHDGETVFVSGVKSIRKDGEPVDGIMQLDNYKSICTDILEQKPISKEGLQELGKSLLCYNEYLKTISVLGWIAGCFIKERLRQKGIKFPHLALIGEAGSGKSTTLEKVIFPIFSMDKVTAAPQVTQFTLMKETASSNMIPFALDEFKPAKIDPAKLNALFNMFRCAYDVQENTRGKADQTTVSYKLLAPIVFAGEESATETAVRERTIEVLFMKKDLKDVERRKAFRCIERAEKMMQAFGRALLGVAMECTSEECAQWHAEGKTQIIEDLPERIVSNLACCYSGLKLVERLCEKYGLKFAETFEITMDECVQSLQKAAVEYLLGGSTSNKSVILEAFEIMSRMHIAAEYCFIEDKMLYMRVNEVYDMYTKYCREHDIRIERLQAGEFKKQLSNSGLVLRKDKQKKVCNRNRKYWEIDLIALNEQCDIKGFLEDHEIEEEDLSK